MPRDLWWSLGAGLCLMSEVPLHVVRRRHEPLRPLGLRHRLRAPAPPAGLLVPGTLLNEQIG